MSRKVFMSVGGRYWSTLITRLFFKVLIQNIYLFILRYPGYILKLRQWERLFWSIHCMLCCVTHMHLMMHTIRSACPLSLSFSLSLNLFLVYFLAHLPLPTRPTRIALTPPHGAIRWHQLQEENISTASFQAQHAIEEVLSPLYTGLLYSNDNNVTPQRSAFTFKGILLGWGWISRSPKANRRPLYWDPPHRPGAIIPETGGYTVSAAPRRRHLERRRRIAMRARGDPFVTPHWSVPGIAQRRVTHDTPTPTDTLFPRLTVRRTCRSSQMEESARQPDDTTTIIITIITTTATITITANSPPGTTCLRSPDPSTLTPLACPPELSLSPSPGTKRLCFLSHLYWLDRGLHWAERRVQPPPPHPLRYPRPPAAPPADRGGPAQHLLKRTSTWGRTSTQYLDR